MKIKRSIRKQLTSDWQLYIFLLLPILYLLVFNYYPILGLQMAFKKYSLSLGIWGSKWVGFDHFKRFFSAYQFERIIKNTLILSAYSIIAGFPVPIILALIINAVRNVRFKIITQTISYMPHFISTIVVVGIIMQVLNPQIGIYGVAYRLLTGTEALDILGKTNSFSHVYVWSGIWQSMGWNAIIYIAALTSVNPELHEAAEIDGANRLKRMIYVDFPSILPTAIILLIMNAGRIMSVGFEKIYLMQNPMNLPASEVISTYVYKVGFTSATSDFSYGAAIGLFNSVINLVLIVIVNAISKRLSAHSLW